MTDSEKNTSKAKITNSSIYTTIKPQNSSENLSKTDLISTKSHGPKDQSEEVNLIPQNYFESVLNLTKPLNANNNNNNKNDNRILNDEALTKDIVISAVDSLIIDLNKDVKVESTTFLLPELQKIRREDNQTNTVALKSEIINENQSEKLIASTLLHDLEDQPENVELDSENLKSILNSTTPLYVNNNTENILNDEKLTKDKVISVIDSILIDMTNDVKVELTTVVPRPEIQRTRREGVRMNTTALRREMYIKKRLHNNKHK